MLSSEKNKFEKEIRVGNDGKCRTQDDATELKQVEEMHTWALEKTIERLQLEIAELRWKGEALRESEKRFRNIALSMVVWIWEVDEEGVYTYSSERVKEILGYSPEEVTGKSIFDFMPPNEARRIEKRFKKIVGKREIINDLESWNRHKNGDKVCLVTSGIPILDERGVFLGYQGVHKDITEQKQAEEALREANRRSKKFDRLKSDFISMVSHEIHTPINIMREGITLCLDGLAGDVTEMQEELLNDTLESVERLDRLVMDLLDLSKIEEGRIELRRNVVDLCRIVIKIKKDFEKQAGSKNLRLQANIPEDGIQMYVDKDKIIQIFHNLISNAMRYTKSGGAITLSVQEDNAFVRCSVSDTGVGIAKENISKLFSKFKQFGHVEGSGYKGTGLGLAIAKGLVEIHGGKIWAESTLGKGSTFYFSIKKLPIPDTTVDSKDMSKDVYLADTVDERSSHG